MKFIFAGGGTGGHIYPAIAVADEVRRIKPDSEILFVGAKGRIEEKIVPDNGYILKTIDIKGFNRKNLLKNNLLLIKIIKALKECKKILNSFKPDVVIGTGGFASGPVVYSAYKSGIPTLVQEGNSYPGFVTKYLSSKVNKVVVSFDETIKYLKKKDNVVKITYPIRSTLAKINKAEAEKYFDLSSSYATLLIFGGSQGAKGLNDKVKKVIPELYNNNINVIWQTGNNDYKEIKDLCTKFENKVKIFEFINEMKYAYSAADLVLCRAGISSIMELAYLGIPGILVPLPGSAEDHQLKNAQSLYKRGACEIITQNELEDNLLNKIMELFNKKEKLKSISENIKKICDPDSAVKIAEEIFKLIK